MATKAETTRREKVRTLLRRAAHEGLSYDDVIDELDKLYRRARAPKKTG